MPEDEIVATWLPDPLAHDGYVVILFYDDESKWSMVAQYNRARVLGGGTPNPPTGAALPVSAMAAAQHLASVEQ